MNESGGLNILEFIAEGVVVCDQEGKVTYVNDAARRMLGMKGEPLPLQEWAKAYSLAVEGVDGVASKDLPFLRLLQGEAFDDKEILVLQGTEARYICASGRALLTKDNTLVGAVVSFHDITRHRLVQEELKKHRWFLESIVENVPLMIFVKDAKELRFERFNRAGEDLLGLPRSALLGKTDYDFFPREQADFFTERDRETLALGRMVEIPEEPIETKHGLRWLYTRKVPIMDERGEPVYLLGISLDITERKAAEEALLQAHQELERRVQERTRELERANQELRELIAERERAQEALRKSEEQLRQAQKMEAIGRLAGGVAHDFNNMLTVILSYAQLLQEELGENPPKGLKEITQAAERAAALTRQLLAFSRQQVLQPKVLDLGRVVQNLEGMLRRLIGEDIVLVTHRAPDLGLVRADPNQIEQVILNLVVNARDAMPWGGTLTIETSNVTIEGPLAASHSTVPPGEYVMLAISDTGIGMDSQTLARAFEPFFTTKPQGKGTGLGLSMCYGIVKQSGGDITVYSEPGRGTTFKIYLPRVEGGEDEKPGQSPIEATSPSEKATILLVEDEEMVRTTAQEVLTSHGYDVLVAHGPSEAILLSESHPGPIDLLLTDVIMPEMSGREMAERIECIRPGISVLFMSGYTDNAIVHHGVLDKGVHFLPKPFTPALLLKKVREVLERPFR